jgi:hypothetical protein
MKDLMLNDTETIIAEVKESYENGLTYLTLRLEDDNCEDHKVSFRFNKDHSWNKGRNNDSDVHSLSLVNTKLDSKDLMEIWEGQIEMQKMGTFIKQVDLITNWNQVQNEVEMFLSELREEIELFN